MDIARGTREAKMGFISPWGESVRGALMKRLKSEMMYYDFFYTGGTKIEKQKTEIISEVINMPELYNANPSVFVAALYVWIMYNRMVPAETIEIPDSVVEKLQSVLNIEGKPDNQLNEIQLSYAIKANIIRYIYAIDAYVRSDYYEKLSAEQAEQEANEDLGEMDEEQENEYDEDF